MSAGNVYLYMSVICGLILGAIYPYAGHTRRADTLACRKGSAHGWCCHGLRRLCVKAG